MKWKGREKSSNVEDRRGASRKGVIGGGLGVIGIIIYIIVTLLGGNPEVVLDNTQTIDQSTNSTYEQTEQEAELTEFVSVVLADTENVWTDIFNEKGWSYEEPKLVLYNEMVQSSCGISGASTGPFYCPGDRKVYIDLSFYNDLSQRYQAPGDFAMAYVMAHEVGHHVQTLLGITDQVMSLGSQMSQEEFNEYLVRLELQADYFAGVWAHHVQGKGYLESGDIEEAMNAASAVGDDRIQKQTQGYVVPDSFTHGTSEQRVRWFRKGLENGTIEGGDTFSAPEL